MASGLGQTIIGEILDLIFQNTPITREFPSLWLALYTVAPTATTAGTEVSGGGYQRMEIAAGEWTRTVNAVTNDNEIEFPEATDDQGEVVAVALMTASSGGVLVAFGTLATTRDVTEGVAFRLKAGEGDLTLT